MSESREEGLAVGISETTTSVKHNRTNPQLQHAINSELNQFQSNTKGQLLTIEKEDCFPQVNHGQQTTIIGSRDSGSSNPSCAMQWALLVAVTIITLVTLVVPLVFAILIGQALLAIPSVGTLPLSYVWVRLSQFVFPTNKRDHEYRMAKLWLSCFGQYPGEWGNRRIWERKQLLQDKTDNTIADHYKNRS